MNLLPIDELNSVKTVIVGEFENARREERKPDKDFLCDEILDLLIISYMFGHDDACEMLDVDIAYSEDEVEKSTFKEIEGKNFKDRIIEYCNNGTAEDCIRVADTEMHRVYNEGSYNCANGIAETKKWETMMDDKVRETHFYLQSMEIPMNEMFNTIDGDSALCPGGFLLAENNVNCRCYLTYSQRRL